MANITSSVRPLSSFSAPLEARRTGPELWTLPRGGITEILGEASTGRTALAQWMIANATRGGEVVAVVDCDDAFDPASAQSAGADLGKLLWVQCGHRLEIALKATDLILHSGGFGLIVLDLGDVMSSAMQKVPMSYWYRFQRAVEHTPSALLIVGRQSAARSCSIRQLDFQQQRLWWRGRPPFQTLERLELQAASRKPMISVPLAVQVLGRNVLRRDAMAGA
jgi:recA bacterial DNA recombination protein